MSSPVQEIYLFCIAKRSSGVYASVQTGVIGCCGGGVVKYDEHCDHHAAAQDRLIESGPLKLAKVLPLAVSPQGQGCHSQHHGRLWDLQYKPVRAEFR